MPPPSGEARVLLAGVARAVITPPIGIRMVGYTVQEARLKTNAQAVYTEA